MKAAQIDEPNKIRIVEKPIPEIANDDEVLIHVRMVGICGSDLHVFHGKNPFAIYPRIFGHEFTGEIEKVGKNVTNVSICDHVVVEPIFTCGKCYACRKGRGNVCESLQVLGVHTDGGCQEYVVVPAKNVHKVNKSLSWEEAVLAEPLTIGAQANFRGNVQRDDVVLIFGAGTIGLCVLLHAKLRGAVCIITDLIDEKLAYAKSLGADYALNASKVNPIDETRKITNGVGANVTIDTVCTTKSFEDAVNITSAAGSVVVLGMNQNPSSIPQVQLMKKELNVCGSRLQTNQFPKVVALLNDKKLNLGTFITQHYAIDEIEEAFLFYENNPNDVRKIVVEF